MHAVKKAFCRIPFNPRQKCRIETCWSDFLYLFLCSFGLYPLDGDKYFAADVRAPHSLISLDQCKQKHCKSPCFVLWPPDLCVLIFHLFISSHVKQKVRQRNTGIFFANIYHASLSSRQWVCWLVLHFFFFTVVTFQPRARVYLKHAHDWIVLSFENVIPLLLFCTIQAVISACFSELKLNFRHKQVGTSCLLL